MGMIRLIFVMIVVSFSLALAEEIDAFYDQFIADSCFSGERTIFPLKQTVYRLDVDVNSNEILVDESKYIQQSPQGSCGVSMLDYSTRMKMII